nr:helix-turn-helix domain-containing protein [uncultured Tateyamaria sp.]
MKVAGNREAFFRMTRTKRLTNAERMEIVREAQAGVSTKELAKRFGVTPRAVRYTLKADAERQTDAAVSTVGVTVKLTIEEAEAFEGVLQAAGIETRTEGLRRLIQGAGGTFVPDANLASEMARYREELHRVGNGVAQLTKQMLEANRQGLGAADEFSDLRLAQMRGLARFVLDTADEIDLLVRRRRDAMKLQATAALREFAHAAE